MTTQLDASIGLGVESTYGTGVTPTKFPEFLTETFNWKPTFVQGAGFRVGSRVARNERRALGKNWVEGDLELECVTRGLGVFFNALLGSSVSTLVSGSAYQQVHTLTHSDPLPSYTIQKGIPLLGGGAAQPITMAGAVVSKGELAAKTGEIVTLKTSWNAKSITTATAYAAPSYIAANEVFTFVEGAITVGGTVTNPTNTALATGGTAVADVLDFDLQIDNGLDANGFTFGGGGMQSRRPVAGLAKVTGTMTIEFDAMTYLAAYLAQTPLAVVLTFTSATVISAGVSPVLQIVCPLVKLEGDTPNATNGVVKQTVPFTVLDPAVSGTEPLYVVIRTADTAI